MTRRAVDNSQLEVEELLWALTDIYILGVLMELIEPCVIGQHCRDLPEPYRSRVTALINLPVSQGGMSADQVGQELYLAGLRGSASAVTRHRLQRCSCYRPKEVVDVK